MSEEETKRQRLAKLAAWRQQQAGSSIKVEQPSSPKPMRVFDDGPEEEDEKTLKQQGQTAAWWVPAASPMHQVSSEMLRISFSLRAHSTEV